MSKIPSKIPYKHYYKHPFPPEEKKPAVITRDKVVTEIYPPDKPYTSNIVWLYASTDKLSSGVFMLPPGARFAPPDVHDGDEVYYILKGTLTVLNPETGGVNKIHEGEALLIPKDTWHQGYNFTNKEVRILWVIAPRMWDPEKGPAPPFPGEPKLYKVSTEEE